MKLTRLFTQFVSFLLCVTFTLNSVVTPAVAQSLPTILNLPVPGAQVNLSPTFKPVLLKGMTINPENPLAFDFIVNAGDSNLKDEELKNESMKLVKYFMAALTVPENDLWVNLSPSEKNRIIPENFGYTDMGRDLLAQDYLLKQITATLLSPDGEMGKKFWDELNRRGASPWAPVNGQTQGSVPTDFLSKIWIVPDQALVYEHGNSAFVAHCHLKVMMKEDVQDLINIRRGASPWAPVNGQTQRSVPTNMIKETIIPTIEREINEGKNFAQLRQVFNSLILATWYKQALQNSLFNQLYANQNKVTGIDIDDKNIKQKIYDQYLAAFKKGVHDLVREEYDPATQEIVNRHYFSGGVNATLIRPVVGRTQNFNDLPSGDRSVLTESSKDFTLTIEAMDVGGKADRASVAKLQSTETEKPNIVTKIVQDFKDSLGLDSSSDTNNLQENYDKAYYKSLRLNDSSEEPSEKFIEVSVQLLHIVIEQIKGKTSETTKNIAKKIIKEFTTRQPHDAPQIIQKIIDNFYPVTDEETAFPVSLTFSGNKLGQRIKISSIPNLFKDRNNLTRTLTILTLLRLFYDFKSESKNMPFDDALKKKIVFNLTPGIFTTPISDSFRRHILFERDVNGTIINLMEIKIPGENDDRRLVEENGATIANELNQRFGAEQVASQAIFQIEAPGMYEIYGQNRYVPLRINAFSYLDGYRIGDRIGNPLNDDYTKVRPLDINIDYQKFKTSIVKRIFKSIRAVHRTGYVGTNNIKTSLPVENTASVRDISLDSLRGMDASVDKLLELGIINISKAGNNAFYFRPYLSHYVFNGEIIGLTKNDSKKLLEMYKNGNPLKIISRDMHLGNFKLIKDAHDDLYVIFINDTAAFRKPSKDVYDRVSKWEIEAIRVELEILYKVVFDDSDFDKMLLDIDLELDELERIAQAGNNVTTDASQPTPRNDDRAVARNNTLSEEEGLDNYLGDRSVSPKFTSEKLAQRVTTIWNELGKSALLKQITGFDSEYEDALKKLKEDPKSWSELFIQAANWQYELLRHAQYSEDESYGIDGKGKVATYLKNLIEAKKIDGVVSVEVNKSWVYFSNITKEDPKDASLDELVKILHDPENELRARGSLNIKITPESIKELNALLSEKIFIGDYKVGSIEDGNAPHKRYDSVTIYFNKEPSPEAIEKLSAIAQKYGRGHQLLGKKIVDGFSLSEEVIFPAEDIKRLYYKLLLFSPSLAKNFKKEYFDAQKNQWRNFSEGMFYAYRATFEMLGIRLEHDTNEGFKITPIENPEKPLFHEINATSEPTEVRSLITADIYWIQQLLFTKFNSLIATIYVADKKYDPGYKNSFENIDSDDFEEALSQLSISDSTTFILEFDDGTSFLVANDEMRLINSGFSSTRDLLLNFFTALTILPTFKPKGSGDRSVANVLSRQDITDVVNGKTGTLIHEPRYYDGSVDQYSVKVWRYNGFIIKAPIFTNVPGKLIAPIDINGLRMPLQHLGGLFTPTTELSIPVTFLTGPANNIVFVQQELQPLIEVNKDRVTIQKGALIEASNDPSRAEKLIDQYFSLLEHIWERGLFNDDALITQTGINIKDGEERVFYFDLGNFDKDLDYRKADLERIFGNLKNINNIELRLLSTPEEIIQHYNKRASEVFTEENFRKKYKSKITERRAVENVSVERITDRSISLPTISVGFRVFDTTRMQKATVITLEGDVLVRIEYDSGGRRVVARNILRSLMLTKKQELPIKKKSVPTLKTQNSGADKLREYLTQWLATPESTRARLPLVKELARQFGINDTYVTKIFDELNINETPQRKYKLLKERVAEWKKTYGKDYIPVEIFETFCDELKIDGNRRQKVKAFKLNIADKFDQFRSFLETWTQENNHSKPFPATYDMIALLTGINKHSTIEGALYNHDFPVAKFDPSFEFSNQFPEFLAFLQSIKGNPLPVTRKEFKEKFSHVPNAVIDLGLWMFHVLTTKGKQQTTEINKTDRSVGGINFDPKLLDLQIKRDEKGIPLPLNLQPIELMNIKGFVPIMIRFEPAVQKVPLLLGLKTPEIMSPAFSSSKIDQVSLVESK